MTREFEQLLCRARAIEAEGGEVVERDAAILRMLLEEAEVVIPEDAVFAGSFAHMEVMKTVMEERAAALETDFLLNPVAAAHMVAYECRAYSGMSDFGHTAPAWDVLYRLGFCGVCERLEDALAAAVNARERDWCQRELGVWHAAISYLIRMAEEAKNKGKLEMAEGLLSLTRRPPQTLFEAMQLTFLYFDFQQTLEATIVRTLGRLDLLWNSLLEADLASGRLTERSAEALVDAFLMRWNLREINSNLPFTLGGDGGGRVNTCSYLLLKRHVAMNLPNVKIHILYDKALPHVFLRIATEGIRRGSNSIVFINDERTVASLCALGIDSRDAKEYSLVGCYEPCASEEVPCSCNGRINLAQTVNAALFEGKDLLTGRKIGASTEKDLSTFDAVLDAFFCQLETFCLGCCEMVALREAQNAQLHSAPFFSALFEECLRKKGDVYADAVAKYNNSSVNIFGLATAVDSLLAIQELVFVKKLVTLDELRAILQSNWQGHEALRVFARTRCPKFGTSSLDADILAGEILLRAASTVNGRKNGKGGIFRLGAFSIHWRHGFGRRTGATSDGRFAGETVSKNLCASFGIGAAGVTSEILSVSSLDGMLISNGSALDLTLHASAAKGEEGLRALEASLEVFMERGGMTVQYNVLDAEVLRAAQKNPEEYANLQVRLCGWNVLFSGLTRVEQDEFIRQVEERA